MDIGKSAINAQRQALNVTGQNIANVNTEGYRRRDADLKEVSGSQSELSSKSAQIGLGVSLGEVRRAFNAYLAQSTNSAESKFQSATRFVETMERVENAILPTDGDLSAQITEFFSKLSDISLMACRTDLAGLNPVARSLSLFTLYDRGSLEFLTSISAPVLSDAIMAISMILRFSKPAL